MTYFIRKTRVCDFSYLLFTVVICANGLGVVPQIVQKVAPNAATIVIIIIISFWQERKLSTAC